jgi:thiol-disulfide isomerase/thioredoxin
MQFSVRCNSFSFLLFCTFLLSGISAYAQSPVYNFEQFEQRIKQSNDTLYIANFWATWCKPCIEELPHFETAAQHYKTQPVKIILVSMDSKSRTTQVQDFISKNNYTSENFILSAGNPNVWIDKINSSWSGAIPMTVMYRNQQQVYFYEGDYASYELLNTVIISHLN